MAVSLPLLLALLPALATASWLGGSAGAHRLSTRSVDCIFATAASNGDTCDLVASSWGLSVADFQALNPGVSCPTLVVGREYCVLGTVTQPPTSSSSSSTIVSTSTTTRPTSTTFQTSTSTSTTRPPTTSSTRPTTTTSTTTSIVHEPSQPGLAANCNNFYFVQTGDTCVTIGAKYGISTAQFISWNPAVGSGCTAMWANAWVCVGVPGAVTTPPATPTPTPTPTGPQPQMPGIATNCKKYYKVASGNTCETIQAAKGITLAQIRAWNTMVNAGCTNLWLDYYICVGV